MHILINASVCATPTSYIEIKLLLQSLASCLKITNVKVHWHIFPVNSKAYLPLYDKLLHSCFIILKS